MNVKPGDKAAVKITGNPFVGMENDGIVCIVEQLKPPGKFMGLDTGHPESPEWVVTAINRPFQAFKLIKIRGYAVVRPERTMWTAVIEDRFLRRIVEDTTPVGITESVEA